MQISTAARRITRELNRRPVHTAVAFDADGHVTGHIHGQNIDRSHLVGAVFDSRSDSRLRTRWTQSLIQELLDERAAEQADLAQASR